MNIEELEKELLDEDPDIFTNFEEKRSICENNSYICTLIRNDSIVDFITYVNEKGISLSNNRIKPSVFETNALLRSNSPTLIKYAAFFGSIQIFKYIQNNNVELKRSLWKYAIHGNNPEILTILEENKIKPKEYVYEESIKCHHNEIANYIDENYNSIFEFDETIKIHYGIQYSNFNFIPCDSFDHQSVFCSILNYQKYHPFLSNLYIETKDINQDYIYNTYYPRRNGFDIIHFGKFQAYFYKVGPYYCFVSSDNYPKMLKYVNFENIFKIRHNSLVYPVYYNCYPDRPGFIFNWYEKNLYKFLKNSFLCYDINYGKMDTAHYIIILGIAIALNHIQSLGMIHYLFLPSMIYLDSELYPRVAGLGISNVEDFKDDSFLKYNLIYLPPEIKLYKNFDAFNKYSNVYTFAVLAYLLLPENDSNKDSIIKDVNDKIEKDNNYHFEFQKTGIQAFDRFIEICLSPDPEKRKFSFKSILDTITDASFYRGTYNFYAKDVLKYLDNQFGYEFDYLKEKICKQNIIY